MHERDGARLPPQFIQIVPPNGQPTHPVLVGLIVAAAVAFAALPLLVSRELVVLTLISLFDALVTTAAVLRSWQQTARFIRDREALIRAASAYPDFSIGSALRWLWRRRYGKPTIADAVRAFSRIAPLPCDRSRIVAIGSFHAQQPGEFRFPPVFLIPSRAFRQITVFAIVFGTALVVAIAGRALPGSIAQSLSGLASVCASGMFLVLIALFLAVGWRAILRPRYVRLAPGQVDIVTFSTFGRRISTDSFPMDPGTLVLVYGTGLPARVVFARNDCVRTLHLIEAGASEEFRGMLWAAILSTAPTPPLPDDELLG